MDIINSIQKKKEANKFDNYINYLVFPFYKNFEKGTKITFDFPITALVGLNGTGKTSILHALRGAVKGKTPERYWFDTPVDTIKEKDAGIRQMFFYEYTNNKGEKLEVAKARRHRDNNPDYWETTKPAVTLGMKAKPRNTPVDKEVLYLDFKSQLSAFDNYLLYNTEFGEHGTKAFQLKKTYIRNKSKQLKNIIDSKDSKKINNQGGSPQNKEIELLSQDELDDISYILYKNTSTPYTFGALLNHKFFKNWGDSVFLSTDFHSYSDAMAGSGEIAVTTLVHTIHNAKNNSLILLDEPEISLHPGAQIRLQEFLLRKCLEKSLQIVISTHSKYILNSLPKEAIKKLVVNPSNGKISCDTLETNEEAFNLLEIPVENKVNIHVEDSLAKKIIDSVISHSLPSLQEHINVISHQGGAQTMFQQLVPGIMKTSSTTNFIIFDGDQNVLNNEEYKTIEDFTNNESKNLSFIEKQFLIRTNIKANNMNWMIDGHKGKSNSENKKEAILEYLSFYEKYIYFLPGETPEDLIWNERVLEKLYPNIKYITDNRSNKKDIIKEVAQSMNTLVTSDEKLKSQIEFIENTLIENYGYSQTENFEKIKKLITSIWEKSKHYV
ncbi:ATP-binding protein [Savagea sp. SN6]|uniref:ATP-binding protein n=1 Tax=Savagea serpentis TaxID=2785297 RepID=A0A8J7G2R6_9BACL|nr:AAA family ATPase [Savagea serpentis]MBF4500462.1 ATP-binding protein [Savagea serpentis]